DQTQILLPVAPATDHILTFAGDVAWPNKMEVLVNDRSCGEVELTPGYHQWEVSVPAEATTRANIAVLTFRFAMARVPNFETGGKNTDQRVCNLELDWIHIRTTDQPAERRVPARLPETVVNYGGVLKGVPATKMRFWPHNVWAQGALAHSCYANTGFSRDFILPGGKVWYCNGFLGDQLDPTYWRAILEWGGVKSDWAVAAPGVIGARLQAGTTTVLAVYNTDITKPHKVSLAVKTDVRWPLAEAQAITRDGQTFVTVAASRAKDGVTAAQDTMRYYGLYQFSFCPVKPTAGPMQVVANGTHRFEVKLTNLTSAPVSGRVTLRTWLPSIKAPWVSFRVGPKRETTIALDVKTTADLEWGQKTAALVIEVGGREAFFWRPVMVLADPEWQVRADAQPDGQISVTATATANRWATRAPVQEIKAALNGQAVPVEVSDDQATVIRATVLRPEADDKGQAALELSYRVIGVPRRARLTFAVPAPIPQPVSVPEDAVAAFIVHEPGAGPGQPVMVELDRVALAKLEKGVVVRDGVGMTVAASIVPRPLSEALPPGPVRAGTVLCSLPSAGPGPFFLCPAESDGRRDLRVESLPGGRVRVQNSELLAVFDPAAGGTITELRWRAGRNLARNSFGASWGQWGKFDPLSPTISADRFLSQERKSYQHSAPAQVTVAANTPAFAAVWVTQKRRELHVQQWYFFYPYVPFFEVVASAKTANTFKADEISLVDIVLDKGDWDKIFPNFTGVATGQDRVISGGWREGPYVPPVATIFNSGDYRNSFSLVNLRAEPKNCWFRQGFFPRDRGQTGIVDTARLELVAKGPLLGGKSFRARATVLLHDGYQWAAEQAARTASLLEARLIGVKGPRSAAAAPRPDWWHPGWPWRAKVGDQPIPADGQVFALPLRAGELFLDPASVRAVWQEEGRNVVLETNATPLPDERVIVSVAQPKLDLGKGTLFVYARTTSQRPVPVRAREGVSNPSFEAGGDDWALAGAVLDETQAHTGKRSVKLYTVVPGGFSLAATSSVAPAPNSTYRVSFWARTETPNTYINLNFYSGERYDFKHVGVTPISDGQWHRYEIEVPTGDFPPTVRPDLRIWVYHLPGPVWIDDVEVQPTRQGPAPGPLLSYETYTPAP
ncbi:MAG: hypothetical protein N2512_13670, partial [Armatimonadetes bacterium]|nr:hypothetical protein [Armatimonadota bacterium]